MREWSVTWKVQNIIRIVFNKKAVNLQATCIPGVQQISILVKDKQTGMCSKNTQLSESKKQHSFGLE